MTDSASDKSRERVGQGVVNIGAGPLGGMAGCAMIDQSVINVSSGARGRSSCLWAGAFLLFLILVLDTRVSRIPMAALVAVMVMVPVSTFRWGSLLAIRLHPKSSSFVMPATAAVLVLTHDLAKGVLAGVLLSGTFRHRRGVPRRVRLPRRRAVACRHRPAGGALPGHRRFPPRGAQAAPPRQRGGGAGHERRLRHPR